VGNQQFELCCKRGDAILDRLRAPPPFLRALLEGDDPRARSFRQNIRAYNSALAFTSVSYTKDTRTDLSRGLHCFQIHGELFHYQGPLQPGSQETPAFAQLFFYDPDYATDIRLQHRSQLDRMILRGLHEMLADYNPFIRIYKTARERLATQTGHFRILLNPQMHLVLQSGADRRRENLPTSTELAGILPDEFTDESRRDVLLAVREPGRNGQQLHRVPVTHAAYMPLHYVLLFPHGEYGWNYGLQLRDARHTRQRTRFEQRPFYRFRLHTRSREFSPLFYAGRLFQQYVVDAFVACETTALDWFRKNQDKIRADVYSGLTDTLIRGDASASDLGRRFILPSSFTGGDRFMQQLFQDSMAIVRYFGKPTFFITFTANPRWLEIVRELLPGQQPTDRPDLIARVFRLKVQELLADLKNGLFGPYAGHVYTIEYQKRGLPHMHLLLFLQASAKFDTPKRVDEVVCAEIPDPSWDPTGELRALVTGNMLHGPCGDDNPHTPCMVRQYPHGPLACSKRFPKPFTERTMINEDGYPEYCRRDNGQTFTVRKPGFPGQEVVRDNRWVVPYNPYLLRKFHSHINVEVCATVQAVKYIHKYVYKGTDRTTIAVTATDDEITRYVHARYVSPCEAIWRLFEFSTHQEFPPVQHLAVHLEGQQTVYFPDDISPEDLAAKTAAARSTLMAFFDYNAAHEDGREYLYSEFPTHFVWVPSTRTWKRRQRGKEHPRIGRIYHCSPVSGERYYLRLLLTVVRGPRSFTDLYFDEDVRYPTYQAACIARGLAENDQEWFQCFDEAVLFTLAGGLRTLFLTGLRQRLMADPLAIWEKYKHYFCDDLWRQLTRDGDFPFPLRDPHYDYGLFLLADGLTDQQQSLADHGLPSFVWDWTRKHRSLSVTHTLEDQASLAARMQAQLNPDQLSCFTWIVTAIDTDPQTAHFYLQGPGGTGKTFLYKTICHYFRGQGRTVLCVASTGIAALLLPNGRTSHSQFKIPIELHESSVSSVAKQSALARILRFTDLIIWDEVPMQHKYCFEVVHRLLVDLRSVTDDVLFGGVPVILGGDFAQILPVVQHGQRADIVTACLQRSFIWPRLKRLSLRTNMRVREGQNGQDFVRWISELPYDPALNGMVSIPDYINQPASIMDLINHVYPPDLLLRAATDPLTFSGRCLLTTLNTTVAELNALMVRRLPGQVRTYQSVDSLDTDEASDVHELPVEQLQSIDVPSLPPSQLHLKVGAPVMLLRNLCPQEGLCNGSRMVITALRTRCIEARLLGGDFDGQLRVIPRIKLSGKDNSLGIAFSRKQLPVRLCFVMTINKSQGQSFHTIGLDLRTPVFTHGQFYVAVSRTSSIEGLSILIPRENLSRTLNVTYPEVLANIL
jgi:hypothetical protein